MAKNFIQDGSVVTMKNTTASPVVSGQVVKFANLIGVATNDAAVGEDIELATKGVFEVNTGITDVPAGYSAHYNDASGEFTHTSTDELVGVFVTDVNSEVGTAHVRLDGKALTTYVTFP